MTNPTRPGLLSLEELFDKQALGRWLRALRKSAGLTQGQLGQLMGWSGNYIGLIEMGKRGIGMANIRQWTAACGAPTRFSFAYADESGPQHLQELSGPVLRLAQSWSDLNAQDQSRLEALLSAYISSAGVDGGVPTGALAGDIPAATQAEPLPVPVPAQKRPEPSEARQLLDALEAQLAKYPTQPGVLRAIQHLITALDEESLDNVDASEDVLAIFYQLRDALRADRRYLARRTGAHRTRQLKTPSPQEEAEPTRGEQPPHIPASGEV